MGHGAARLRSSAVPLRGRDVAAGLAVAACGFTAAFRGRQGFWQRMTVTAGSLGALAIAANPSLRSQRPRRDDVLTGLATAAGLYGVFRAGDVLARRIMPRGGDDIAEVYARRRQAPRTFIVPALALVIAPGEELFWRGLVNEYAMQRLGPVRGALAGAAVYGGIHVVSGNQTLIGAAAVAGAWWSAQHLLQGRIPALVVSHAVWDIWIFLVQPTMEVEG